MDEEGAPLLDWGLAVEALNKVDAGVPEKVGGATGAMLLYGGPNEFRACVSECGGWEQLLEA